MNYICVQSQKIIRSLPVQKLLPLDIERKRFLMLKKLLVLLSVKTLLPFKKKGRTMLTFKIHSVFLRSCLQRKS